MEKHPPFALLKSCPCCRGKAEISDMVVSGTQMWQVHCNRCGLSSELDDDMAFSVQCWNRRLESERLRMWLTLSATAVPLATVLAFLAGSYLGISLFS
ncbi:Lar family restriction alleviation protein [Endozoicomonas euniceicola]|uniref:Lar family restriction alleviation protein n=1 Tax=Endozoicomonas euniceicola TaxID=1234143 RepID=A0ABY6H045_9GAMM|nr:Lar family restriction alleviation protein [Endozoicomonas euniceicola]UYM18300.1 Lar family restriction alleviation protein [Endozoicomonas euniceicola]